MTVGVYKIENTLDGKLYIGCSSDIKQRFQNHRYYLRSNKHNNRHLQNAWNKYGKESFNFEIIFKCRKDQMLFVEQYYMDKFKSYNRENGYNIHPTANYVEFSDEHIENMSGPAPWFAGENNPQYGVVGEENATSKLNNKQVRKIKTLLKNTKLTNKKIGKKFNVSAPTISRIKRGVSWEHVELSK